MHHSHRPDPDQAHPQKGLLVGYYDWVGKLVWQTNEGKGGWEGAGTGGMGEMCRGAHKSLYKGSVADANSPKQL